MRCTDCNLAKKAAEFAKWVHGGRHSRCIACEDRSFERSRAKRAKEDAMQRPDYTKLNSLWKTPN